MTITDIQPGRRSRRRVNVYLDGEFAFACFVDIASQFGLRKGSEFSAEQEAAVRAADELVAAREYALGLAARGPRTEQQFREKLAARGYGAVSQDEALAVLRSYGYLDDEAYARQYSAELADRYGAHMVRRKLFERGIDQEIIERVCQELDTSTALEQQLEKVTARQRYDDPRRERDRVIRALAAKGFAYDDIRAALSRQSQEGTEDT